MGNEAKETATPGDSAPESKLEEGTPELTNPEIAEKQDAAKDFGGLFGDEERPSEAELKGEEEEKKEEPEKKEEGEKPQETPDQKKGEEKKAADSEPTGKEKAEDKKEEEKKEEPEKPPEGYVPKQALAEARGQNKALKDEIQSLKAEVATLKAKPQEKAAQVQDEAEWKDFKVLSSKEFNELLDEDPSEAVKYQAKLIEYREFQRQKDDAKKAQAASQQKMQDLITDWTEKIAEAVPGIYEEGSEVGSQLATFAEQHGFGDAAYLEAMTDPRTLIIPYGQDKTYLMGPGAASLLKLLSNAQKKISNADPDKLREEIIKEHRPKIVEEVTKELTSKFKDTNTGFRSLGKVPGGGEEISGPRPLSEEEWAKLPPEKREQYLKGE